MPMIYGMGMFFGGFAQVQALFSMPTYTLVICWGVRMDCWQHFWFCGFLWIRVLLAVFLFHALLPCMGSF